MGTPTMPTMGRDLNRLLDPSRNDTDMLWVRGMSPISKLLEGRSDPTSPFTNDQTMLDIRQKGAPMASSFGVPQMPALPAAPTPGMPGAAAAGSPSGWMPSAVPQVPTMPSLPGSRIGQSQFNRGYAPGSLAGRGATPVGRSANDPTRIAQMMRRRGNYAPILQLGQMQMQQEFQAQQQQNHLGQQREMFDLQRQDQAARDAQDRQDRKDNWTRDQEERQRQEEERRTWNMTQHGLAVGEEAMRYQREQAQREADRNRTPTIGTIPVPGTDYVIPTADGHAMGTLPTQKPPPEGPKPEDIAKHIQDMQGQGVQAQYGPNGWTYVPAKAKADTVKVVNELGKVVDFPADHELPPGWKPLKKRGDQTAPTPAKSAGSGEEQKSSFLNF